MWAVCTFPVRIVRLAWVLPCTRQCISVKGLRENYVFYERGATLRTEQREGSCKVECRPAVNPPTVHWVYSSVKLFLLTLFQLVISVRPHTCFFRLWLLLLLMLGSSEILKENPAIRLHKDHTIQDVIIECVFDSRLELQLIILMNVLITVQSSNWSFISVKCQGAWDQLSRTKGNKGSQRTRAGGGTFWSEVKVHLINSVFLNKMCNRHVCICIPTIVFIPLTSQIIEKYKQWQYLKCKLKNNLINYPKSLSIDWSFQ